MNFHILCLIELDRGEEEQRIKDWHSLPSEYCFTQSAFKSFQNYAKSLIVENDHSKRTVGMMQQFIHRYSNEEDKQNTLLTVEKVRCAFRKPGRHSNKLSKSNSYVYIYLYIL